jgi:hypothetical protein
VTAAKRLGHCMSGLLACAVASSPVSAWSAGQDAPVRVEVARPTTIRIAPIPLRDALSMFQTVCAASHADPASFDRSVEGLQLGFERMAGTSAGAHVWRKGERYFTLESGRDSRSCSLRIAISERLSRDQLLAQLGAELAPGAPLIVRGALTYWEVAPAGCTIDYLPASQDLRLFTIRKDCPIGSEL